MHFLLERLASSPQGLRPLAMQGDEEEALGNIEALIVAQIERIVANRPRAKDDATLLYAFGMPSVVELAKYNGDELASYAQRLENMIRNTEPRLENPRVRVVPGASEWLGKELLISGDVRIARNLHPFTFTVQQDGAAA
ncbi:hypothetical protein IGB42_00367 [Andreprevotia sp. IGB-42]|uniref:hypothetical protein n=1 Tax=Andreprevotia sp. IGB-42 TaxID=2497473 RepID=UPI00135687B2|nr:hypothetical protein [Andreprevotia sp. IGB-42]KAF0815286.1 hypothetical protein IGB42_00367 [Andreprevotia sp. IGB-42]